MQSSGKDFLGFDLWGYHARYDASCVSCSATKPLPFPRATPVWASRMRRACHGLLLLLLLVAAVLMNVVILGWQQSLPASLQLRPCAASLSGHGGAPEEAVVAAARGAAAATGGTVLLTFVRWEQADDLANYLAHLRAAGLSEALVAVALDEAALGLLQEHGISGIRLSVASAADGKAGQAGDELGARARDMASHLQAAQWRYLAAIVQAGVRVWLSDVRTLWRRPPPLAGSAQDDTLLPSGCDVAFAAGSPADGGVSEAHPSLVLGVYSGGARTARWLARLQGLRATEASAAAVVRREAAGRCASSRRGSTLSGGGGGRGGGVAEAGECPRWCLLPTAPFPNGLATFQQPALLRESDDVAATDAANGPGRVPTAVVADWVPSTRLEYRLREAGLWQAAAASATVKPEAGAEKFLAYKELLINNGLSNTRNALRSALAVATLTNRTLILPPFWSRHLVGEPHRVGVDYYFDLERLLRAFPRTREASLLRRAFPSAAVWPPEAPTPLHFIQLSDGEQLCAEVIDTARMEALGNVAATCPPLQLPASRLRQMRARRYHLGASSEELAAWLAPYSNERLLYFGRMFRRFHRFTDAAQDVAFRRRYADGVQPAPEIRAAAARALRTLRDAAGGDGSYDCVHMRRRDFVSDHAAEELSVEEYAKAAAERLRGWRTGKKKKKHAKQGAEAEGKEAEPAVYLASDVAETPEAKAAFAKHFRAVYSLGAVFPRDALDTFTSTPHLSRANFTARSRALASEMRFGNVDQLLCSDAAHFVGNKWSSFTHHVCYLRQQRGFPGACVGSDIYGRDIDKEMDYV